jgi:hypothetical protein
MGKDGYIVHVEETNYSIFGNKTLCCNIVKVEPNPNMEQKSYVKNAD